MKPTIKRFKQFVNESLNRDREDRLRLTSQATQLKEFKAKIQKTIKTK